MLRLADFISDMTMISFPYFYKHCVITLCQFYLPPLSPWHASIPPPACPAQIMELVTS